MPAQLVVWPNYSSPMQLLPAALPELSAKVLILKDALQGCATGLDQS